MKKAERARLIALMQGAIHSLKITEPKLKDKIEREGEKYTPTSYGHFRKMSEFVWWLIAWNSRGDALDILNALCVLDDDAYWVFQAVASGLATRAWLSEEAGNNEHSLVDAQAAFDWLKREWNAKPITKTEVDNNLDRFDRWMDRARGERGHIAAAHVISHALRVVIIYQQLGKIGCQPAQSISQSEYNERIEAALTELRLRIGRFCL